MELADDVGQGVGTVVGIQPADDLLQPVDIVCDLPAIVGNGGFVVGAEDQITFFAVPPVGEDSHPGGNQFVFLLVAKLVADGSCFSVDRRWAEFYFNCSHILRF